MAGGYVTRENQLAEPAHWLSYALVMELAK
jgi:hypothetical protein